ncbi:MAG: ABC transporter permease [Xanthomonadaceae bacterium]|nr:ABC transporter permease [Xanthomonadaceae bacterium]
MSLFFRHLAESFRKPDHWLYASWLDVITKYRKNVLGLFWIFFPPIIYIWGLGGFLAAVQGRPAANFLAHIGFGFMVFRLTSTMLMEAGSSFAAYQPYILEGNLRLTDFVMRPLARSVIHFIFAVPLLVIALVGETTVPALGVLASFAGFLLVLVNLFVYGILLALLGARFPDVNDFLGSVMLGVFLITPIFWFADSAPPGTMQGALMRGNPFHHMLEVIRAPLLGTQIEPLTFIYLGVMTVLGILLAAIFYSRFARRVPAWL